MSKPGATGAAHPIDAESRAIAEQVRADIEARAGGATGTFEPVEYSTQVVAGTNFFFKINVGNGHFVHARVFRDLPHNHSALSVRAVKTGLNADEPLVHFQ